MTDWLTPAQQSTLLVIAALVLLIFLLRRVGRWLRRAYGTTQIMRAQEYLYNEPDIGFMPGPWRDLRGEVEMANRVLDRRVYLRAERLFLDHYAQGDLTPAGLSDEFAAEEFLMVVDEHGQPSKPDREIVDRYQKTVAKYPLLQSWFREVVIEDGQWAGVRTLTAARWLCHLVGLRHAVAEIFLDPPDQPGHTYVRELLPAEEFPAAIGIPPAVQLPDEDRWFELPCAVHVTNIDTPEAALESELQKSSGLGRADLIDMRLLARYNDYDSDAAGSGSRLLRSNEHRLLYRARLKAPAADGSGLMLVALEELRALLRETPDRLGPRMRHAVALYDDLPGQTQRGKR